MFGTLWVEVDPRDFEEAASLRRSTAVGITATAVIPDHPNDMEISVYDNLELKSATSALADDVTMDNAVDSPTTIPCGITISITLQC